MIFTQLRVLINEERWEPPFSLNGVSHLRRDCWGSGVQMQAIFPPPFFLPLVIRLTARSPRTRVHAAEEITCDALLCSQRDVDSAPLTSTANDSRRIAGRGIAQREDPRSGRSPRYVAALVPPHWHVKPIPRSTHSAAGQCAAPFDGTNTCSAGAALKSGPDTARRPSVAQRPQQRPAGARRLLTPHDGATSRPVRHHAATPVSPVVASAPASPTPRHSPSHPSRRRLAHRPSWFTPGLRPVRPSPLHPPRHRQGFASRPTRPPCQSLVTSRPCRRRLAPSPPHPPSRRPSPLRPIRRDCSPSPSRRVYAGFTGGSPLPYTPTAPLPCPPPRLRAQFASTPPRVASTPTSPSPRQSPPHAPRRRPTPALASASGSSAPDSRSICLHAAPLVSPSPHHSHPCPPRCHIAAPLASASGSPL